MALQQDSVIKFTNTSTRGPGITYTWDFGLGAIVSATDYTVKEQFYSKPGQYTVSLRVSDGIDTDSTSVIITIARGPVAKFTADPVNGCPPLPVSFRSTSTPGETEIINTFWDFRNGDTRDGSSVQYTYTRTGQFDLILKVTDKNGCSSQLESENVITAAEKPIADFAASDTFACAPPLNVSFTNLSEGSSDLTYRWDFGNGNTSSEVSNSSVYDSTGSYSVKLTATDQFGCSDSLIKKSYIKVGFKRGTLFVYDGKNRIFDRPFLCDGTYRFVYSDPDLPDYTWTITDNNKKTTVHGKNSLTWKVSGTGQIVIRLVYGKNSACTDSLTVSYIKSYIKAAFSVKDTLFCSVPLKLNLTNSSVNADRIAWYFSDKLISTEKVTSYTVTGNDLPKETYEQLYSHEVNIFKLPLKLVVSNGGICYDSVTSLISIAKPVARFMPDKVSGCVPLEVTLSDSSKSKFSIDSYTFKIGSDSLTSQARVPLKYTFTKPGEYLVSEIIKSGNCYDTSHIIRIVAGDKLRPDFTISPAEVCNGGTIHLSANSSDNSPISIWRLSSDGLFDLSFRSLPDTSVSVYSDITGSKDISLLVNYNGCISDTTGKNILKIKGPAGNFTGSFRCDSSLVYKFRSSISPATSLIWNIDTISFNDVDSLRYVFPSSGDYQVNLTASDLLSGCTLNRTRIVNVRQVLSEFTLNDTVFCAGDSVKMDASFSRDYKNTCYNEGFLWYFGDDSPPRRTFLTKYDHIYTARGADTITLVVSADNGCTDTSRKVVHIYRPEGSFTSDKTSGCLPELKVSFENTSSDTTIVGWIWSFGDNLADSTNRMKVTHIYSSEEQVTYYPSLTVYDAYSCSSSYAIPTEIVGFKSDFQADDNAICAGQKVTFVPASAGLTDLWWDFGDGITSETSGYHTYLSTGVYSVSMAATKAGCRDTVKKSDYITVEKADAGFTASDTTLDCYPEAITFTHNNTSESPVVDYLWSFGTQVLLDRSSNSVKYTFTKPGNFKAQLIARTLNGCTATRSENITVNGPDARITFSPKEICYNNSVYFRLDSMKNVSQYKWLFGDGNTSTANPVSHKYTSRGKVIPTLQMTNATCTATRILDTISVALVQALFSSSDSTYSYCYGTRVNLLNSSKFSNSWSWIIDNVPVSTTFNLNNIPFSNTGIHSIKLIARKSGGCSDTLIKNITINPNPEFSISGDSVICAGKNSVALNVQKKQGDKIKWTPSSSISDPSAFTVSARPKVTTTYTVTVTNSSGCSTNHAKTIFVNEPFDLVRFPRNDTVIYLGESVQLKIMTTSSNVSYKWSPGHGISCLHCSSPWVTPVVSSTYSVEMKDGCFDVIEKFNIEVVNDFYLDAPSAFTPNGDSNNDIFRFEAKNISGFALKIFNRWGEIVFSTDDINNGWDGNVNGHPQNIDTYKYMVEATTIHGYKFIKSGEFLLLR